MDTRSCCCSPRIGSLRALCLGERSSHSCRRDAGRHGFRSTSTAEIGKDQNVCAAGTTHAIPRGKWVGISCSCGILTVDQRGSDEVGGGDGGLHRRKGKEALVVAGIGTEWSLSQPVSQKPENTTTPSFDLLRDYSILESPSFSPSSSSSCIRCTCQTSPSGFVLAPRSSCSCCSPKGNDGQAVNRRSSTIKSSMRTLAIAACFGGIGGVLTVLLSTLPPDFESRWRMLFEDARGGEGPRQGGPQSPTVLYDRHGIVIASIAHGGYICRENDTLQMGSGTSETTTSISPAEIPAWMWQAVVASEDRRFFKHQGVDPRSLCRAVVSLATRGGGSTITQQLIKNVILTNERKWTRKLSEIILALILEKQMSKWDILHCYLKKIYWGHGVYGIEGASSLYFGKHPSHLTLGECAMLAGIIPAPEVLSPYRDPSRGKKPQGRALRRMVESGFLDAASAVEALEQPLKLASESNEGTSGPWKAPYFVSEVLSELTQKYGWSQVACGGLQVHTTLDLSMQTAAEEAVLHHLVEYDKERILLAHEGLQETQKRLEALRIEHQQQVTEVLKTAIRRTEDKSGRFLRRSEGINLATQAAESETREEYLKCKMSKYEEEIKVAEKSRMEAAMVAIDPLSGAVRVLVGGRDFYDSNFNRGTKAFRSAGSTLEPVVYLTALAEGLKRSHVLMDEPFTTGGVSPQCIDRKFCSTVTLEEALVYSLNVPIGRLCAEVGVDKVREMGRALGIKTFLPYDFPLSVGGYQVTPMQLATVYATIAGGGIYQKPHFITRIESQGHILEEQKPSNSEQQVPVVNQRAVAELRRLLQAVVDKGTGRAAKFGRPCAGKSGTSKEHKDVWFAGFTPEISCVVWLGYDDNTPVGGLHPGASHAVPVWREFMKKVHEGVPVRKFHDIGSDKNGSRAPKPFVRRARRLTRIRLRKIRKNHLKKKEDIPREQVWDWERASASWNEQEKMDDWFAHRMRRNTKSTHWDYSKHTSRGNLSVSFQFKQ